MAGLVLEKAIRITAIKNRTKAMFWEDVIVGDTLELTFEIKPSVRRGNRRHAEYVDIYRLRDNQSYSDSTTYASKRLEYNFEWVEV